MTKETLSSVMPSSGARGNGPKLIYKKLHLHSRKSFLTVRVVKHWAKMPRAVVEYVSIDNQNQTDHGPGQPALGV